MNDLKPTMLITENKKLTFSQKVCKAAKRSKLKMIIASPDFHALSQILSGQIGTVILDQKELGRMADLFFKSIRMFHCSTPVLLVTSNIILLEKSITYKFERKITLKHLGDILLKSLKFEKMVDETEKEFMRRVNEIRHLTGEELKESTDRLRKEIFSEKFFKETNKILPRPVVRLTKKKSKVEIIMQASKMQPIAPHPTRVELRPGLSCNEKSHVDQL